MVLSDNDLIIKAQRGDNSAFEELVYRYDKRVLSVALKYVKNNDDAKDIYQEVFIRVYRSIKKFQFKSEFSTWLYRITANVCFTFRTKQQKHTYVPITEEYDEENINAEILAAEENETSPAQFSADTEIARQVDLALEKLSPKQKMSFILKHYEGYKIREIAEMMNCKEGTIKKYLFDGIQRLRVSLSEYSDL